MYWYPGSVERIMCWVCFIGLFIVQRNSKNCGHWTGFDEIIGSIWKGVLEQKSQSFKGSDIVICDWWHCYRSTYFSTVKHHSHVKNFRGQTHPNPTGQGPLPNIPAVVMLWPIIWHLATKIAWWPVVNRQWISGSTPACAQWWAQGLKFLHHLVFPPGADMWPATCTLPVSADEYAWSTASHPRSTAHKVQIFLHLHISALTSFDLQL